MPRFLICLGLAASGFWLFYPGEPPEIIPQSLHDTGISANAVHFEDVTRLAGIDFQHIQRSKALAGLDDTLGAGACAADFNNDGWLDIFFVGGSGHTRHYGKQSWWNAQQGHALYLNSGGGYFVKATSDSGLHSAVHGMGCLAEDLDNDGNTDILVTVKGNNQLFRNLGDGRFQDVSHHITASAPNWSTSAIAIDVNNDGLLDIFIANYLAYDRHLNTFERDSGFQPATPPGFTPALFDGVANELWINQGNLRFTEEASTRGIVDATGRSISALSFHADNDMCPDLLVINDRGSPNKLYRNNCRGTFNEESHSQLRVHSDSGRFVTPVKLSETDDALVINRKAGDGSVLLANNKDSAWDSRLNRSDLIAFDRWGAAVADFDGNGLEDLFMAQGLATRSLDTYAIPQGQANSLFLQTRHGNQSRFVHHTAPGNESSRSAVSGDFNNDGKPDVLVTQNNGAPTLLINKTDMQGSWLGLALHPDSGRIRATQVIVNFPGKSVNRRLLTRPAFLGSHDPRLLITWPEQHEFVDVAITTSEGRKVRYPRLAANRYHSLDIETGASDSPSTHMRWFPQLTDLEKALLEADIEARSLYVRLVAADPTPRDLVILDQLLIDDTTETLRLIRQLAESGSLALLPLYTGWLDSASPDKRQAGIKALESLEDDTATRMLVSLLNHSDVTTSCRTAKVFQRLFRKEEAAIHSKWLAVPELIRLAIGNDRERQLCALDALAEAEHVRALDSLMERLHHTDVALQVKLIRVLGRTRQTRSIPAVTHLLNNTREGAIAAESLIALKRMADPEITTKWERFFTEQDMSVQAAALLHLVNTPDGTVFSQGKLAEEIRRLIANARWPDLSPPHTADLLNLIRTSEQAVRSLRLEPFYEKDDPEVRLAAYLLTAQRERSFDVATLALRDKDAHIKSAFVEYATTKSWPARADTVEHLMDDSTTRPYVPALIDKLDDNDRNHIIAKALRYSDEDDHWYRTIDKHCRDTAGPVVLPVSYFSVRRDAHLKANLYCGLSASFAAWDKIEGELVLRNLLTQRSELLLDWLAHNSRTPASRRITTRIVQIAGSEGFADEVMVAQLSQLDEHPLRFTRRFPLMQSHLKQKALMSLTNTDMAEDVRDIVARTAANRAEELTTRLCAALLLTHLGDPQARELVAL